MVKNKTLNQVAMLLVFIGALKWLLIGVSYFIGMDINIIEMVLGGMPTVLNAIYVAVGVSGVYLLGQTKALKWW